ncbi:MAG: hypothetical protein RQ722_04095 [Desulfuromonadales bacterium]|nr:hypothetical protein [Desulfuromonadales bacterium]
MRNPIGYRVLAVSATAELISCRTADGTPVFTEDPTQVPTSCQPIEVPAAGSSLNIVPSQDDPPSVASPTDDDTTLADSPEEEAIYRIEAEELVERYMDAQKRRMHESFMVDKQTAMREMAYLRTEKSALLTRMSDSNLDRAEQQQIRAILDRIPEI